MSPSSLLSLAETSRISGQTPWILPGFHHMSSAQTKLTAFFTRSSWGPGVHHGTRTPCVCTCITPRRRHGPTQPWGACGWAGTEGAELALGRRQPRPWWTSDTGDGGQRGPGCHLGLQKRCSAPKRLLKTPKLRQRETPNTEKRNVKATLSFISNLRNVLQEHTAGKRVHCERRRPESTSVPTPRGRGCPVGLGCDPETHTDVSTSKSAFASSITLHHAANSHVPTCLSKEDL